MRRVMRVNLVRAAVAAACLLLGSWPGARVEAAAVPPGAPTITTVTVGAAQVTLGFSAPSSTGGSAITGYTVTAYPGATTVTGPASPLTLTGLSSGTGYTLTLTATNAAGIGAPSTAFACPGTSGCPATGVFGLGNLVSGSVASGSGALGG